MKKNLILLVASLLCKNLLTAQNLNAYTVKNSGQVMFSYSCTGLDDLPGCCTPCQEREIQVKTEYPPWIIDGAWHTYFLVNGIGTYVASSPTSMVGNNVIDFHNHNSTPILISGPSGCPNGTSEPWRFEYYCTYSAQYIYHPTAGTVSVGFVEGENYELPGVGDPVSGCGLQAGDINTTFLGLAWTPNAPGQQYFTDMGPIMWPATGYFLPNGYKSSYGCGNNATIQADGYVYVFYKDQSYYHVGAQMGDGRLPGIRVARAPISDALNPLAYRTFYEDPSGGIHWNPSLPAGFNKSNIQSFYATPGPQGSRIVGFGSESDRNYTRFAVARVANIALPQQQAYYLGVGSYEQNGDIVTTLKYSYDLLHWFGDREIDRAHSYEELKYTYPIFLSANGTSNTVVNENDFYIIGTNPNPNTGSIVYRKWLYIYEEPTQPVCYDQSGNVIECPPPICYDEWGNQTFCPPARKATTGTAATLDNSKERAPFVYPNPGSGTYQLRYTLKGHGKIQLNVVDLLGRQIKTGSSVNRTAGTYTETVNISGYPKGVYLLELLVNGQKQTFKVINQ